jgi:hypothetical protein
MIVIRSLSEWYLAHVRPVESLFGPKFKQHRCPAGCCDKVKAALRRKEARR